MKTLSITLPLFLTIAACGSKDADTGAEDDEFSIDGDSSSSDDAAGDSDEGAESGGGAVMNASPGCDLPAQFCYSFSGPAWAGQDISAVCNQLSGQVQAEGGGPMTYVPEGCPAGAMSQCSDVLMGGDADGNPVAGTEGTIFYYMPDQGGQISTACSQQGGTFAEL